MDTHRDLSRMQERIAQLERRNLTILNAAGEGIYGLDCDGRATFVNPAAAAMVGFSVDELVGSCMHDNHHHSRSDGSDYPRVECPIYAAFKDGKVHHVDDEVFWRKDGTSFPAAYTSTPIWEDGQLTGAVVVFRDITELKRADESLRQALLEVQTLKEELEQENVYLQEEIQGGRDVRELVGESPATSALRLSIDMVSPSDASVLITGESGTGKELVARAIHSLGPRKDRPLIKVNCASIPRELFESEFFGHVKGAYTGALRDRTGRFELAHRGTLFLDEVGEIPLDMQSKLLRVLQEGEYERVGSDQTHRVDVRIIAATNRNLRQEADDGRFRQDLFYRLNVFPIDVAPLRDRLQDIGPLAAHFLQPLARRARKRLPGLTPTHFRQLEGYDWPGNVRELHNVIERAVVRYRGGKLAFDVTTTSQQPPVTPPRGDHDDVLTDTQVRQLEVDNFRKALEQTEWRVYGPEGAATLLGLKPTTLSSRLKKLGIRRPHP